MTTEHQKLRLKLGQQLSDGLIIINATPELLRNGDVIHSYRQDSYFLYLTAIEESGYRLVIDPKTKKTHLFIPDISDLHQLWVGRQLTKVQAKKEYKPSQVHYESEWDGIVKTLSKKYRKAYLLTKENAQQSPLPKRLKKDHKELKQALDHLRLYKSDQEIKNIQKANDISNKAHQTAMKTIKAGAYEYEVLADLESEFVRAGAFHKAYHSIVASGSNAAILHYINNNALCKKSDLMLIDAGCEWKGYAADITRTFPVSGQFSKKQKDIYNIVLHTQMVCIKALKPGVTMSFIHILAAKTILKGLSDLGVLKTDDIDVLFDNEVHRLFFPHGIGHLLGLDVHDVGAHKAKSKKSKTKNLRSVIDLQAGMVITIEPGIYFIDVIFDSASKRKGSAKFVNWKLADSYRSVGGIRIEDNILITKAGYKNLTKVPKTVKAIEALMAS